MKKKTTHYVDNKRFFQELVKYKELCKAAAAEGKERPQIPNYIGVCIYDIATRVAKKPNFYNYTYKDEMISDGIENCIIALHNFDPARSENPFAYFTQIIHFAFLRRIKKEKKQSYIKHKTMENFQIENHGALDVDIYQPTLDVDTEKIQSLVDMFETPEKKPKPVKPKQGVELFFDDPDADEDVNID